MSDIMSELEQDDEREEELAVQDMREPAQIRTHGALPVLGSMLLTPRTVRQRAARTLIAAGMVVLLAVVVLASTPGLRDRAAGLARGFLPSPAPTPVPG